MKAIPNNPELDMLERALTAPNGIKLGFKSKALRAAYRMKLYRVREADRRQAAAVAERPVYKGLSPYDCLAMNYFETKAGSPGMHICIPDEPVVLEDE